LHYDFLPILSQDETGRIKANLSNPPDWIASSKIYRSWAEPGTSLALPLQLAFRPGIGKEFTIFPFSLLLSVHQTEAANK